jgi:hypothetical protein
MSRRAVVAIASLALAGCQHVSMGAAPLPAPAMGPVGPDSTTAADTTPKPDTTTQRGWTAGNLAVGTGVVVVRARYGGRVFVGAGTADHTIALTFTAPDVEQFVTDARALLPPHAVTNQPTPVVTETGSSRAMSLSRVGRGTKTTYHFYFADEALHGFPLPTTVVEAKAVLAALARGAAIAREATPKPN